MLITNSFFEFSYLRNGVWDKFVNKLESKTIDGLKARPVRDANYYLRFRTLNEGQSDFNSFVTSNENDYAGLNGRPIQCIQFQVFKNDNTKLTSRIVVMYRVSIKDRWLPWVSNADPEWMQSVFTKYHFDGTLDTDSYYAGNIGENINGLEIRIYDEQSVIDGGFTGGTSQVTLSYMVDDLNNWHNFTNAAMADKMDGIKIQTSANKNYYLEYQTKNEGFSDYLSPVKSTGTAYNDYAGLPGNPIQLLHIHVCDRDGANITSGIVVMYRVHVDNRWLPWVSNADPEWMRDAAEKYNLSGALDTVSTYAGNDGQNINGVEVRIFEDDAPNPGMDDFTGDEIKLNTQYMTGSLDNWKSFDRRVYSTNIDGIKIQTDNSDPFYFMYKSWNYGNSGYYPVVRSTGTAYNDYAGYPGEPIQLLSIQVFDSNGNELNSEIVVMYRVSVNGRWLPWVSNADPEWMRSVQLQYDLDGTLDTVSTYAGNAGQNIDGVEIRVFRGQTDDHPLGDLPGTTADVSLSYMRNSLNNWTAFSNRVQTYPIEGIKIQTSPSKEYYLVYKSKNEGMSDYFSSVKSTGTAYNDYAGLPGYPIQLLNIQAYSKDGMRLRTGIVVMYRVSVDGRWLPWVSNADPEWMRSVQTKYSLGGTLDFQSGYAGNDGQNIDGVEIWVFEENDSEETPPTPSGEHKIINVGFIPQNPDYPNGCESVSTVMALKYVGLGMSVDHFIDNYLPMKTFPFDPDIEFGNDPRDSNGWGCNAPVIKAALDKILAGTSYTAQMFIGLSIDEICSRYIDNDIPVIFWATQQMQQWYYGNSWYCGNKHIQWISPFHCLLLVGYDDNNYIFNDPQDTHALTYYSKESVRSAYTGVGQQIVVITKKEDDPPENMNQLFDKSNYNSLKNELIQCVENDLSWVEVLGKWHTSEETLDIVLSYDYTVTELCNEFGLPKEILQTVFFREQRFDWFLDTGADIVVAASYSYDHALEKWMALPELEQMTTPQPQMPVGYRHDCSTGLCQIFASTAINSINFAVDTGIISDERKYDSENLEDLEIIWYKLRDDDKFNLKCAVLTLMYEALSTLGYDDNFSDYTDDQIAMLFTKYNSTDELPNDYGKDCTNWYRIFKKYK